MGKCGEQLFHTIYTGLPHTAGRSSQRDGCVSRAKRGHSRTAVWRLRGPPAVPSVLSLGSCTLRHLHKVVSSWHTAATRDPDDTVLQPELARLRGHLRQPLWQPEACIFLTTPCCSCYKAPTPRRLAGAWPRPAGPGLETRLPERFCSKATARTMSH